MKRTMAWLLLVPGLIVHANDADTDEAFFEFLGTFGDAEEGWIDPLWLEEVELADADAAEQDNEREDNETTSDDDDKS